MLVENLGLRQVDKSKLSGDFRVSGIQSILYYFFERNESLVFFGLYSKRYVYKLYFGFRVHN